MHDARRRLFTTRIVPTLSLIALGATVVVGGGERTATAGGSDAGQDGGVMGVDGSVSGSCPVAITAMDISEVNPPKANTQGSCTDAELGMVTGKFSDILNGVSPKCASCLFTESTDTTNTQFFVWADAMHVSISVENFGACLGSPLSGGNAACGKAAEELESCLEAACPRDAMGATTCTDITDADCIMAATAGDCKKYDDKQTSDCGGATALKAAFGLCFDSKGSPDPGIKLLCGGAAVAAGGSGDGGAGGGGGTGSDAGKGGLGDDQQDGKSGCSTGAGSTPSGGGFLLLAGAMVLVLARRRERGRR